MFGAYDAKDVEGARAAGGLFASGRSLRLETAYRRNAVERRNISFMLVTESCRQDGLEMDGRVMQRELAMRILAASIVIGPLLLIGALPAAGRSTTPALGAGARAPVQLAAGAGSTTDKNSFTQKAREEIQEWQRKLHDFGGKTEAKGKETGDAAQHDLHEAWTKAEAASRKLQAAGAEDWESAKASYEKASRELSDAWHRVHPDDK